MRLRLRGTVLKKSRRRIAYATSDTEWCGFVATVENGVVTSDSTTRFSTRVENYVRFRPGYPAAVAELLRREYGLGELADVGSGTGLVARVFLDAGFGVTGIEPNREMRLAGDQLLADYPRFRSIDARAEATTLADQSVGLIVAGQAFHWFDVAKTRREWQRILRPGGGVALIWNRRFVETPLMREVEAVTDKFAALGDPDGAIREAGQGRVAEFFGSAAYRVDEFPNQQQFDFEGLLGRIASSSYLPMAGQAGYEEMAGELGRIFEKWQADGTITFEYRTKVFHGRLG